MTLKISLTYVFAIIVLISFVYIFSSNYQRAEASAPTGLPATIATSSNLTLAAVTSLSVFATSTCAARIVTTSGSAVMMTFSDRVGDVPTGSFGHLQPASTTVAYDSGQYGCGLVRILSFGAQFITVSESR